MAGFTPSAAAVPGMSWVRPRAPAGLVAFALKFDSWRMRPRRRAESTPYFLAAASISVANGVEAPGVPVAPDAPVEAAPVGAPVRLGSLVAAVAGVPATEASWAAKLVGLDDDVELVPVVVVGVPTGAPAGERPSMASSWATRATVPSMLMRAPSGGGRRRRARRARRPRGGSSRGRARHGASATGARARGAGGRR